MGLFSFLRKNKQQPGSEQSAYNSRSAEDTSAIRASRKRKNPSNEAVDPVLPEKKRARRRLVGAVALVLAVVIVLPMVLDSEPKPLADDIAIQIPSRDKPTSASSSAAASVAASVGNGLDQQEEIIDPASSPVSSPSPSATQTQSAPATPNAAAPAPLAQTSSNNVNSVVPPTAQASADIKPEPKPKAKPETKPKTEAKEERKHTPEPKAIVTAEDSLDVSDAEGTSDSARAAAILNGNTNVANHASAEKKSAKFVIQVAALASQEKVDELQGKLRDAGIRSYTQKIKTASGERIRIRVGPFNSKEEAEKARAKLAPLGLAGSLIPT
ncbi:SPOR domain-containing protein [Glaciimonas sp. PCH181]|uniref:SPOR domain-containing protein n=1 Tax=Glaciimonas sp. PCH181 TaxID=2133943 RepID=UPI000D397970|nr:SPOR domain-containing protein [Glaciimonas sp. PCH181]PUA19059.1 hypothetical protein C7W93_03925 [Glaciimonas sp. PCH181]